LLLDPKTETETLAFSFEGDLRFFFFFDQLIWKIHGGNWGKWVNEATGTWSSCHSAFGSLFSQRESDRSKVGENVNGSQLVRAFSSLP